MIQVKHEGDANNVYSGPAAMVQPVRQWYGWYGHGRTGFEEVKWRRLDSNLTCVIEYPLQALRRSLERLRGL